MSRTTSLAVRTAAGVAVALGAVLSLQVPSAAHKAITSKFTFNEDLFPLFRCHCSRCHVDGGVAPMSLLTYDDAAPWAESLRLEFLSEDAPPAWHPMKLTARELDMMLVWANGGTPRGDADAAPAPVALVNAWAEGPPDVPLPLPAPFTLVATTNRAAHDVSLPLTAAAGREIAALDLLPGNPAIVRSATFTLETADGAVHELGAWMPGGTSFVMLAAPVVVPAGASLLAHIEYKRTWKYEGQTLTDQSTIGLYQAKSSTKTPARSVRPQR